MKKKIRIIFLVLAAFFLLPFLIQPALATEPDTDEPDGSDTVDVFEIIGQVITDEAPYTQDTPTIVEYYDIPDTPDYPITGYPEMPDYPVTGYPETPPIPFTPPGTGTVIDNATDKDGKEFYTITTPDESVFYLVIDKQRSTENVYFLNAVTITDLMALAEKPETPQSGIVAYQPTPIEIEPETPDEAPPPPEQGQVGGNKGLLFFVIAIVIIGGGAGWYFKIYKPKQQRGIMEEDVDYTADGTDIYGDDQDDEQTGDDAVPWYDEDETTDDDGGDDGG